MPKEARRLAVRKVLQLVNKRQFDGVILDWEVPQALDEWRHLANLAKDLGRNTSVHVTMWPTPANFEKLEEVRDKEGRGILDFVAAVHLMTYAPGSKQVERALSEWSRRGWPLDKLVIGLPFFGEPATPYYDIDVAKATEKDGLLTVGNVRIDGPRALGRKVARVREAGARGVMAWELGQDRPVQTGPGVSLLRAVAAAAWPEQSGTSEEL